MTRLNDAIDYVSKYECNGVLKNKLGISSQVELDKAERMITTYKLAKLYLEPGNQTFDEKHLFSIHEYLFSDIYEFAGEIRTENIQKPIPFKPEAVVPFVPAELVFEQLKATFKIARKNVATINNEDDYLEHIADLLSTIDIIHPFREGNGRTEREFLRQYVLYLNTKIDFAEYILDYSLLQNKDNYLKAIIIADLTCNLTYLKEQLSQILINTKNKVK